jgi:hypothetical protein
MLLDIVRILKNNNVDIALNVASTFDISNWVPPQLDYLPKLKIPADAPNEFIGIAGAHLGGLNGLTLILANFKTRGLVGVVADFTSPTLINNGREVQTDWWLSLQKSSPQDICPENDFTEFNFKVDVVEEFQTKLNN